MALLAALALIVGLPIVGVIRSFAVASGTDQLAAPEVVATPWTDTAVSLLTAGLIALVATLAAIAPAWVMRTAGRPSRWMWALVAVPLLLPNYLAYAGWSQARGPLTAFGGWLEVAPQWINLLVGRIIAVVGLAMWVWPIAALILAVGFGRVSREVTDALALEGAPAWRRVLTLLSAARGSLAAAFMLTLLVMLGSAVPLQIAQIETWGMRMWEILGLAPANEAWKRAWPVLVPALAGGVWISRLVRRSAEHELSNESPPRARGVAVATALLVWALAVLAPMGLFASALWELSSRHSTGHPWTEFTTHLGAFWTDSGSAVAQSAAVAAGVGVATSVLAALTWAALAIRVRPGRFEHRAVGFALAALAAAALTPGVLVGSATAEFWRAPWLGTFGDWGQQSGLVLVLGHLARFGVVGVLVGIWGWRLEEPQLRQMRALEGAEGLGAWLRLCVRPRAGLLVGAALAGAALSFHEIESTVIIQPAGYSCLAQQVLEHLHYNYHEPMASAACNLMGAALLIALFAGVLLQPPRPTSKS